MALTGVAATRRARTTSATFGVPTGTTIASSMLLVAPGSILFPGGGWERRRAADPEGIAAFVERELPFGRFGTPEEVADVVAFVASPRAGWLAGASIPVDGGQSRAF